MNKVLVPLNNKPAALKERLRSGLRFVDIEQERRILQLFVGQTIMPPMCQSMYEIHYLSAGSHVLATNVILDMVPINLEQNPFWRAHPDIYKELMAMGETARMNVEERYSEARRATIRAVHNRKGEGIDYTPAYAPKTEYVTEQPTYMPAVTEREQELELNGGLAALGYMVVPSIALDSQEFDIEFAAFTAVNDDLLDALPDSIASIADALEAQGLQAGGYADTNGEAFALRFSERAAREAVTLSAVFDGGLEQFIDDQLRQAGGRKSRLIRLIEIEDIIYGARMACLNAQDGAWFRWRHRERFDESTNLGRDVGTLAQLDSAKSLVNERVGALRYRMDLTGSTKRLGPGRAAGVLAERPLVSSGIRRPWFASVAAFFKG